MDFKKVFDVINKYNIDRNDVLELVEEAKTIDLSDEDNLRYVIRKGAKLAHKDLSDEDEDKIMEIIKERGVSPDLLNLIWWGKYEVFKIKSYI